MTISAGMAGTPGTPDSPRLLRDLLSLLALPAYWSGQEPAFVLRTLFETLESLLRIEVCFGVATDAVGGRVQLLRVRGAVREADAAWASVATFSDEDPRHEIVRTMTLPEIGSVQMYRLPIGYVGQMGRVALGARRESFPDATERTLLHAAISLAATGLENARVIRQRDDAQRAKDDFLAMLGHELRNPLAPIVTALQLMRRRTEGQQPRELEIIERQVRHLRTLVDDLLDMSRVAQGKIELRLEPVDLADVLQRALETVGPLVSERRHHLEVHVRGPLAVTGDPVRLLQVIVNVLTNAAKYTPPGGEIVVDAAADDAFVTLKVTDNGTGIPPDLLPKIFDLFVQGPTTAARSGGGLGIGLTLVKRLVDLHGGTVNARSGGPGEGSEFTITLPASAAAHGTTPSSGTSEHAAHEHDPPDRILVVDDNADAAELASSVLRAAGYHVEVAHGGQEALDRAAAVAPTVVVLDIGLPDLDGYRVAAELRRVSTRSAPRFIALTGYGQEHDRARSLEVGFVAHLVKPVEPERLIQTIRASRMRMRDQG